MGHWSVGHVHDVELIDHVDNDSPDHLLEHDDGTDMDDDDSTNDDDLELEHVISDLIALHDSDYRLWHHRINAAPDDVRAAYWRRALAGHWC